MSSATHRSLSVQSQRIGIAISNLRSASQPVARSLSIAVLEPLERRQLMARDPVLSYTFDNVTDTNVPNAGSDATRNGVIDGDVTIGNTDPSPGGGSYATFNGGSIVVGDPNAAPGAARSNWLHPLLNGGSATLAAYVRTTQVGDASGNAWQSAGITGVEQSGAGDDGFWGNLTPDGRMRVQAGDGAAARTGVINDGAWHLVIFSRDITTGQERAYVDGKLVQQINGDAGVRRGNFDRIGGTTYVANDTTTIDPTFLAYNGDLDQLEIFNRVLSPTEVAQFYGPAAGAPPATPTNVTHTEDVINAVRITFNDSPTAIGYSIRRATSAGGPFTEIAAVTADDTTPTETYLDTGLTAGTQYFYQVVAFNAAGESAPATFDATPAATGAGHTAFFYNTGFWGSGGRTSGNPGTPTGFYAPGNPTIATTVGGPIDVSWGGNAPVPPFTGVTQAENFSTIFTGTLHITEAGTYSFRSNTDDDGILYVAGQAVAWDLAPHGEQLSPNNVDIDLAPGDYPFAQFQAEQGGGAGVHALWITPSEAAAGDTTYSAIPVDNLRSTIVAPAAPTGLSATYDGASAVTLTFTDHSTSEMRYEIERAVGDGPFQVVRGGGIVENPDTDGDPNTTPGDAAEGTLADTVLANGTYKYRVVAVNFNSDGTVQRSAASNEVTVNVTGAATAGPGAQGYYYNADFWGTGVQPADNAPIVLENADATETVTGVNFDYGGNGPGGGVRADNFSTVFTSKLTIPADAFPTGQTSGTFTILGFSDDDSYVYVNNTLVSSDPGGHGIRDPRGQSAAVVVTPITLTAGQEVNLVALQHEGGGGAGIQLRWITPANSSVQTIPDAVYTNNIPNGPGGTATGAPAAPTALSAPAATVDAQLVGITFTDNASNENRYVVDVLDSTGTNVLQSINLPIQARRANNADPVVVNANVTGLTPNTAYQIRVRAVNFNGASDAATVSVTTRATPLPTAAPTDLRGVSRTHNVTGGTTPRIKLAFTDSSTNEQQNGGFIIQRKVSTDPDTAYASVGTVNGSTPGVSGGRFSFTDTTATAGVTYNYRIVATTGLTQSDASNVLTVTAGAPGTGTGAYAQYFGDRFPTGDPQAVVDTGVPAVDTFGGGDPGADGNDAGGGNGGPAGVDPETFSGIFTAKLTVEKTEPYTFFTNSDDGVSMTLVNGDTGEAILSGPPDGINFLRGMGAGYADTVGTVNLTAGGNYLLQWSFSENTGGAGYRVGWSSPSIPQEAIPLQLMTPQNPADIPLFKVIGVTASSLGAEQINVSWRDVNFSETGYEVQRKLASDPDTAYTTVGTTDAATTTLADTTGLAIGQTYSYRVRAVKTVGDPPVTTNGPFSDPVTVTTVVGGTGVTIGGSTVILPGPDGDPTTGADNIGRLTDNVNNQTGSLFTTNGQQIVTAGQGTGGAAGFSTQFDFRIPEFSANRADGFAFVIQRDAPILLGGGGGGLGFLNTTHSLAVKFDIYNAINQTGVYANGAIDDGGTDIGFNIADGTTFRVNITYNNTAKTIHIKVQGLNGDGTPNPDLLFETDSDAPIAGDVGEATGNDVPGIIGGQIAYFGFTGATGGENAEQQIFNWSINGTQIPIVAGTQPANAQVYVRGSAWSNAFRTFLSTQAGQDSNAGFKVTGFDGTSQVLSFSNLNTVALKFSGPVPPGLAAGSVSISSAGGHTYNVTSVSIDPGDPTVALVQLDTAIVNDRVRFQVASAGVDVRLNVLPADVNQSGGAVNAADLVLTRNRIGRSTANPGTGATAYSVFNDVNGDGLINASDLVLVRNNVGKSLPAAPALAFSSSLIAPPSRDRDLLDELQ